MTVCGCGNTLSLLPTFKVTMHTCRCDDPGKDRSTPPHLDLMSYVTELQFNERRRIGAPLLTPAEKSSWAIHN